MVAAQTQQPLYRDDYSDVSYVAADMAGRSSTYAVIDMLIALWKQPLPAGYSVAWDGEWDLTNVVFADLGRTFREARRLLPAVLPDGAAPPGSASDDAPSALADRLAALEKAASALTREAFEPLPPLPPHAPPYLVTLPGHDIPSSKALILGNGILEIVGALRNALVAAANAAARSTAPPE